MPLTLTEIQAQRLRLDMRAFAKGAWPQVDTAVLRWGWHMDAICDHLAYVTMGDIRFFMCNLPPRMSKSRLCSVIWPVWDWIVLPTTQWLTASYALPLAKQDCLASKRLLESQWFRDRWGSEIRFSHDEKLKQQYSNNHGGRRIAISVESTTTGFGGNRLLVDDPHNAMEAESPVIVERTCNWWDNGFQNRMNDQVRDSWCVIGQRTADNDLFSHIEENTDMREVVKLMLPNEFDPKRRCVTRLPNSRKRIFTDPRKEEGELLCPARVDAKRTAHLKKTMKAKYWLQFQQNSKGGGGNIILRDQWRVWNGTPPEVDQIITCWDTAYTEEQLKKKSDPDYSARTDWGIFRWSETKEVETIDDRTGKTGKITVKMPERNYAILLGAWKGRVPYYQLKKVAKDHYMKWKPDYTLIEKKVSGISLIQDFRRLGIKGVRAISIDHGGRVKIDLTERVNIISDMFEDGLVFYLDRESCREVIDEFAEFPHARHDDYVSSGTIGIQWAKRRGDIKSWEDERDDGSVRVFKRKGSIYG
jgi:phage terminase large subunit-like protein